MHVVYKQAGCNEVISDAWMYDALQNKAFTMRVVVRVVKKDSSKQIKSS